MEAPSEDHDVSLMARAVGEVQSMLQSKAYATFSEIDCDVSRTLRRYDKYGDGFERFRVELIKDAANSTDLRRILCDMNRRCEERLRECEASQMCEVNDIIPFIRSSSRILVFGAGTMLAFTLVHAIQECEGAQFFVCEGLPALKSSPHGLGAALLAKAAYAMDSYEQEEVSSDVHRDRPSVRACTSDGQAEGSRERINRYCTTIPDSGVGSILSSVDFVIMGAYCVTEHGGLVHATGSLQVATMAASLNIPVYVLCETFKFAHIFPLSTNDLKQPANCGVVPLLELVPPSLISLVFSEKGMMPPSAVADEMFRFHTAPHAQWKRQHI